MNENQFGTLTMRDSVSPFELVRVLALHRRLISALTAREIFGRYRESTLGAVWAFIPPLFMLAIYTFLFGYIFKFGASSPSMTTTEYALFLYAGLLVFNLVGDTLTRSPLAITTNVSYVKKVVFPLAILPVVQLLSALAHLAIGLLIWAVFAVLTSTPVSATSLWLPVVLLPIVLVCLGLGWLAASVGVYIRDIAQISGMVAQAILFLSPIFYPLGALPKLLQNFSFWNPIAYAAGDSRGVLLGSMGPNWASWWVHLFLGIVVAWLGFACFQTLRKGFADVL
jgi:lipopolysaccharide transport system permease protein